MSAKRQFNLRVNTEDDKEDYLQFERWEPSRSEDPESEQLDMGLSIRFIIDPDYYEKEDCYYDIHSVIPARGRQKKRRHKVNDIRIADNFNEVDDIRDLADWLTEQADEIEQRLQEIKESSEK